MKKEDDKNETQKIARQPEFEGNIMEYVGYEMKYPQELKNLDVNIRVIYSFVVETDGSVSNIKLKTTYVEKDNKNPKVIEAQKLCEAEANRLITSTSGKWEPAKNEKGEKVRAEMYLPIWFKTH